MKLKEWSGTGDKQLFQRVWDRDAGGYPGHPAVHYTTSPAQKELADQLDIWWQERRQVKERNRAARIDKAEALLIRVTVMRRLNVHVVALDQLEIEHLFPVQRVQALLRRTAAPGLPFNSAPNLALLDAELNRRKRNKTLGEYYDQVAARWGGLSAAEQASLRQATGPEKWDVPDNVEQHVNMMLVSPTATAALQQFAIAKDPAGHDAWTPQDFIQATDAYWTLQRGEVLAVLW